jgi:DNA-binding LacI/PurR family transcriptional regulator
MYIRYERRRKLEVDKSGIFTAFISSHLGSYSGVVQNVSTLHEAMPTSLPKHTLIKNALLRDIRSGSLPVGALVPAERELVARFGFSRLTIRHALDQLVTEGVVSRHRGKGTFVRSLTPMTASSATGRLVVGIATAGMDQTTALIFRAAQTVLRERGFHSLVTDCDGHDPTFDIERLRMLVEMGVQGLIIYPFSHLPAIRIYRQLIASGLPLVFLDSRLDGVDADFVTCDNLDGAFRGASELIAAGCHRIAFCAGNLEAWTTQERLAGCRKALWAKGLELPTELIRLGDFRAEFGKETAQWLLHNHPDVDGWFFANHVHAEAAVQVLRAAHANTQRCIRICTFDFIDRPLDDTIRLISVRQPLSELGMHAAQQLLLRISEHSGGNARSQNRHLSYPAHVEISASIIEQS